jgi:hypothetical protein
MDGAVNPAAEQRGICGIDNRIDPFYAGDIPVVSAPCYRRKIHRQSVLKYCQSLPR